MFICVVVNVKVCELSKAGKPMKNVYYVFVCLLNNIKTCLK